MPAALLEILSAGLERQEKEGRENDPEKEQTKQNGR
jgi:hypothetical protein